eukprot:2282142-Amphidinium_carterae.1
MGVHRLHLPKQSMICLQIDTELLNFEAVGAVFQSGQVLAGQPLRSPNSVDRDLVWCGRIQMSVANVLMDHPPLIRERQPTLPTTTPAVDLPRRSLSSTLPWSSESSDVSSHCIAESLITLRHGAGKRAHRDASSSDDEAPLTRLVHSPDQQQAAESANAADAYPWENCPPGLGMIGFSARFTGGRTTYSQPLWRGFTWFDVHYELNRAVRQKKSLWCICVNGSPVDPLEKVPIATVPHSYIQGQLRRLSAPLDYDTLRAQGLLA